MNLLNWPEALVICVAILGWAWCHKDPAPISIVLSSEMLRTPSQDDDERYR